MEPWFLRWPSRLQRELKELEAAGFQYEVDEKLKDSGRVQIDVRLSHNGKTYKVSAIFPTTYPHTPFALFSDDIPDGRHKSAYRSNICFLHDVDDRWSMKDTLALILKTKVRSVIDDHMGKGDPAVGIPDPNPAAAHIKYEDNQCIIVPALEIPEGHQYGYARLAHHKNADLNKHAYGHVMEILAGDKKQVLSKTGDDFPGLLNLESTLKQRIIRWVRLKTPPVSDELRILDEAIAIWPALKRPFFEGGPDIVALVFPDDGEESWVFVRRRKAETNKKTRGRIKYEIHNIRADFISRESVGARVPRLAPLAGKKVALIGCGAIGSAIAMQLGRCGLGRLVLVDHDFVQTGNLPRWVAGANASGAWKTHYLSGIIKSANPFIKVLGIVYKFGSPPASVDDEKKCLEEIFDGTDLIIDATASFTSSHIITELSKERNIPCIYASGTNGSYGGIVARFMPGPEEFCWGCLQAALESDEIPNPPEDGSCKVRVRGCFDPAFTGTGFDMDHVALMAVRMAVATLCRGSKSGAYPDFDWNVGILSLWDTERNVPIAPEWKTGCYSRHPACVKRHV